MRQILALIIVLVITIPCIGQEQTDYSGKRNEINIGSFNAFELNSVGDLGIGYKRLTNNGAFRISTGILLSSDSHMSGTTRINSVGYEISPKVGYEFHQWFNRFRLHYGADAFCSIYRHRSDWIYEDSNNDRNHTNRTIQYGVNPTLGVTLFINKSISISTETYMYISLFNKNVEDIQNDETNISTDNGMTVGLSPLGILSINFHF